MKHKLLLLLVSLLFISCSQKNPKIDGKNGKFHQADKNADNRISVEEFILYQKEGRKSSAKSSTLALINKCDKNHNNKIDFDEVEDLKDLVAPSKVYYKEGSCPIRKDNFSHFDLNNNKIITQEEILSKYNEVKHRYTSHVIKEYLKRFDLDKDGYLNEVEFMMRESDRRL